MRAQLDSAMRLHRSGDLLQALALYQQLLTQRPDNADALHLGAAASLALGRVHEAASMIDAALVAAPDVAAFHLTRAEIAAALGDDALAERSLERAVSLDDQLLPAWNALGLRAYHRGDAERAVRALERACALDASSGEAHNNLGIACQLRGDAVRALECFRTATVLAPGDVHGWNNLGAALHGIGTLDEAADALARALTIEPQHARAHYNLGRLQAERGELAQAIVSARRACELEPGDVDHHLLVAQLARESADPVRARESLERALELDPEHADARVEMAALEHDAGDTKGAEASLIRAITSAPRHARAYSELARCRRFTEDDRAVIDRAIDAASSATHDERSALHYAAAKMLDDVGDYDDAWQQLERANALEGADRAHDAYAHSAYVDRIIACVDEAFVLRWQDAGIGDDAMQPVFLLGMPGGARDALADALARHGALEDVGETRYFTRLRELMPERVGAAEQAYPECLDELTANDMAAIARAYHAAVAPEAAPGTRVLDRAIRNLEHVGLIALTLPRARFVYCANDAREAMFETYAHALDEQHAFACRIDDIRSVHADSLRLMDHWRSLLAERFLAIDAGELLTRPQSVLPQVLEHLDLAPAPGVLDALTDDEGARPRRARWHSYRQHLQRETGGVQS